MNIITFSASKGGVGKTTLSFNYGSWLASKGYKVILVDTDYQANLSSTFNIFTNKNTLFNVFTDGNVEIRKINDNLSILPGAPTLDKLEAILQSKINREFLMMMWMQDHADMFEEFDFMIIDTHPEFGTLTKNMIAISDHVLVPLEPSEYGFTQSKNQYDIRMDEFKKEAVDLKTRVSLIDAKVHYIASRVKHNTASSHAFEESIKTMPGFIANIPEREAFNTSTLEKKPVFELNHPNTQSNINLFNTIETQFNNILKATQEENR